jgi:hypothetical protein
VHSPSRLDFDQPPEPRKAIIILINPTEMENRVIADSHDTKAPIKGKNGQKRILDIPGRLAVNVSGTCTKAIATKHPETNIIYDTE